jgi:type IV pilus assembly protein PilM
MATQGLIGLDIGSSAVRAVETTLSKTGERAVRKWAQLALPAGVMRAGVAQDPAAITRSIKAMWKETRFSSRRVFLSATSVQVAVREISLPNLPAKELRKALPFLVRDVIPIPVDRAVLDFHPLELTDNGTKQRGLLVAMPSEPVTALVAAVERAGLEVVSVDLGAFATLRAFGRVEATDGASVVIDLGGTTTSIVAQTDGVPVMVRTIARGGDEITAVLSERLGVSSVEAEEQKRSIGLEETNASAIGSIVRGAIRPLLGEIRSSLAYFASTHPHYRIERILLTGGGSQLRGIGGLIADQQGIQVQLIDLVGDLEDTSSDEDSLILFRASSANALGLTLGGTVDQPVGNRTAREALPRTPAAPSSTGDLVTASSRRRPTGGSDEDTRPLRLDTGGSAGGRRSADGGAAQHGGPGPAAGRPDHQ